MNIFVTKLDYSVRDEELREIFENFGEVDSAKVIMDRQTGRSKGYGFVEMPDDNDGMAAISDLDGSELKGREIVVKQSKPRENDNRQGRGRGGFGGGRRY